MKKRTTLVALGIILSSQILPVAASAEHLVSYTGTNVPQTTTTVDGGSDSELNTEEGIIIDKENDGTTDIPDSEEIDDNENDSDNTVAENTLPATAVAEQSSTNDVQEPSPQEVQTGTWGTATTEFDSETGTITVSNGVLVSGDTPPVEKNQIKYIVFGDNVSFGANASSLMSSFYNLVSVTGNVDTSSVTNMDFMFGRCSNLSSLDVSNFDTSSVTHMGSMFYECSNLNYLTLGDKSIIKMEAGLPTISTKSGVYTGRWIDNETGMVYTSSESLMSDYDGSQPGTYTWERSNLGIEVKNSTLYIGDSWTAKDNFVSATDKDGNPIDFADITVEGTVDTTKEGSYKVTYQYGGITEEATVTVLENQESVTTKDSTLYVGDSWTAKDNFVSATDRDGNPIDFADITVEETSTESPKEETKNDGGTTGSGNTTSTNKGATSTSNNNSSKLPSTGEQSSMVTNVIGGAFLLLSVGLVFLGLKKVKKE